LTQVAGQVAARRTKQEGLFEMEVDNVTLNLLKAVIQQENDTNLKDSEVGRRVMDNHPQQVLALVERCVHIWRDNAGKTYYRAVGSVSTAGGYTQDFYSKCKWVSDAKDATADYRESVLVTQEQLKTQVNIETELVQVGDKYILRRKVR
jgi:hypothetical protein